MAIYLIEIASHSFAMTSRNSSRLDATWYKAIIESRREIRGARFSEQRLIVLHEAEPDPVLGGYNGIEDFLVDERID